MCHFVLVFFSPFSIVITSLGEVRANLSAFRTFVRFVLVYICRFPLPLGVWEGLRFVIVALPGFFSYLFLCLFLFPIFYFLRDFLTWFWILVSVCFKRKPVFETFKTTELLNTHRLRIKSIRLINSVLGPVI